MLEDPTKNKTVESDEFTILDTLMVAACNLSIANRNNLVINHLADKALQQLNHAIMALESGSSCNDTIPPIAPSRRTTERSTKNTDNFTFIDLDAGIFDDLFGPGNH